LADSDRDIRVVGDGVVSPATFFVLGLFDETNGFDECFVDACAECGVSAAGCHAVDFAEEECGKSVAVHWTVVCLGGDESVFFGGFEDKVESAHDLIAVGPARGGVAIAHHC